MLSFEVDTYMNKIVYGMDRMFISRYNRLKNIFTVINQSYQFGIMRSVLIIQQISRESHLSRERSAQLRGKTFSSMLLLLFSKFNVN